MIITDGRHMVSTESEEQLHAFAHQMGLIKSWYQQHLKHPHYDLTTPTKLETVLAHGAVIVPRKLLPKLAWWRKR